MTFAAITGKSGSPLTRPQRAGGSDHDEFEMYFDLGVLGDDLRVLTRNVTYMEYSPSQSAWSYNEHGMAVADPQGGMFDGDEVRCVGATASLGGKQIGNSACIAVAKDGATRFTRLWYDADGKLQTETVGGTGKYDGMVTTGTVQTVKEPQGIKPGTLTVEYCNRNVGT
jgi:hypothetical protein